MSGEVAAAARNDVAARRTHDRVAKVGTARCSPEPAPGTGTVTTKKPPISIGIEGDRVYIVHILHGARDYEPLLFPQG